MSTIVVDQSGKGDFLTVQAAFDSLDKNADHWRTIEIRPGTYREKVVLDYHCNRVRIIGTSAAECIIDWDDHTGKVVEGDTINTYSSYTMLILADEVLLQDITVGNSAGPVGQAVALDTEGDRIEIRRCRLVGDQDTFYAKGPVARVYVADSYIEGTTDYIFGPSIVLFDHCTIHSKKDSYITAASTTERNRYGYVFRDCTLTADPAVTKLYLGRPWRSFAKTVFMHCSLPSAIRPEGWHNWNSTEKERTVFYAEHRCTGEGADTTGRVAWSHQLTDVEAKEYTPEKIFARGTTSEPFKEDWNIEPSANDRQ